VALRIEARPLSILVCPLMMREKGTTLLIKPITISGIQSERRLGRRWPNSSARASKARAAVPIRPNARFAGMISRRQISVRKKAKPQTAANKPI